MKKATRSQTKKHNKNLLLKMVYDHSDLSQADLARLSGLTRATVSSLVSELVAEGLIAEAGLGQSTGGKPPTLLRFVDDARMIVGVDLASDGFRGGLLNLRGKINHRVSIPIHDKDGDAALELTYELVEQLVNAAEKPILGIGVGTPGLMDAKSGVIRSAVNMDWKDLPLRDLLQERYQLPVYIANDCQVAAQGEYTFGQIDNGSSLMVVKMGRGVGAGIVLGHHIHYGDTSSAGEIGHTVVIKGGEPCLCGNFGCLETIVSSRAIVKHCQEAMHKNPDSLLRRKASPEKITIEDVLEAFHAGDQDAMTVIKEAGQYLGVTIASIVSALDISNILIAGSLSRFGNTLLEVIRCEVLERSLITHPQLTTVELASLGNDIVILGAGALLLEKELGLA